MLTDKHEPIEDCDCHACALAERDRLRALLSDKWHAGEGKNQTFAEYMGLGADDGEPQSAVAAAYGGLTQTAQAADEAASTALAPPPEPAGFRTRYRSEPGMIGHYPWTYSDQARRRADRPEHEYENLYTEDQVMALLAAERERCAAIATRWGDTHSGYETVNACNAASKIARAIQGPNDQANRLAPQQE
jgi:hypothetical protein